MVNSRAAITSALARVRPTATSIDPSWPTGDLIAQLASKTAATARAKVVLAGVRGASLCFVEPGVTISGRKHLSIGRGCLIERGVHIRAFSDRGIQIGDGVTIGRYSVIEASSGLGSRTGQITIGDGVGISDFCFLGGAGGLVIGSDTIVGQSVSFHPENHGTAGDGPIKHNPLSRIGITVGSGCWIGAGVRILDGVTIGNNVTVGAGSVVTRSLPSGSTAYGAPARVAASR